MSDAYRQGQNNNTETKESYRNILKQKCQILNFLTNYCRENIWNIGQLTLDVEVAS